jgi:hypothetical protein
VVALPISDGLQPPWQELHEIHQPKSHSKPNFKESLLLLDLRSCHFKSFDKVSSKMLKWVRNFRLLSSQNPQLPI